MERNKLVIGKRYYLGNRVDSPTALLSGFSAEGKIAHFVDLRDNPNNYFCKNAEGDYTFSSLVFEYFHPVEEEIEIQDTKPPLENKKGWFSRLLNYLNL